MKMISSVEMGEKTRRSLGERSKRLDKQEKEEDSEKWRSRKNTVKAKKRQRKKKNVL